MTFDIASLTEVIVEKYALRQLRNSSVIAYNAGKQSIFLRFKEDLLMQYRRNMGGLAGGIFLIGLALAFYLQHQFGDQWFLPVFFVALGFCILLGAASSMNPNGLMGGLTGFFWMLVLAAFFLTGSWLWFLVGAGISAIIGSLWGPMRRNRYFMYRQPQPPFQQPYQPYQGGYQQPPQQPPGTYTEGGQQHQYPQPHEDPPQAQYSQEQEMPPQQQ
jgi:hypothetical protein